MSDDFEGFLETGYEHTTPTEDTYLRRFMVNWLESNQAVAESVGAATLDAEEFWVADTGRPASYTNTATMCRPLRSNMPDVMQRLDAFHAAQDREQRREIYIFSPFPTPDLRPYGWRLGGHPALHLLPAGAQPKPTPPELRIERVTTAEGLHTLERVAIEGFPLEGLDISRPGALFGPTLLSDPRFHFWLGWHEDRPVGVAVAVVAQGINQVMLIATLPEARGRGFGEALTWEASLADPALPAMLLSSDLGRRVYDRMGYLPLFRWTVWYRNRPPRSAMQKPA